VARLEESILITEAFAGRPLSESPGADPAAVLAFVRRMHEQGVYQEDLHPDNILVAASGGLCLVDLYGVKINSGLSPAAALNLARLGSVMPLPLPTTSGSWANGTATKAALRSKRCLKHNREFTARLCGRLTWWVRKPLLNSNVERILADPRAFWRRGLKS